MRDFYDIYIVLETYSKSIAQENLKQAIYATARKRGSENLIPLAEAILQNCRTSDALMRLWSVYSVTFAYASWVLWEQVMDRAEGIANTLRCSL